VFQGAIFFVNIQKENVFLFSFCPATLLLSNAGLIKMICRQNEDTNKFHNIRVTLHEHLKREKYTENRGIRYTYRYNVSLALFFFTAPDGVSEYWRNQFCPRYCHLGVPSFLIVLHFAAVWKTFLVLFAEVGSCVRTRIYYAGTTVL
jgi:hypothetical protein